MKQCIKCELTFPESKFYKQARNKDGLNNYCKKCKNEFNRKDPKNKGRMLEFRHGITYAEYEAQLVFQKFRCAICNTHQSRLERTLAVDHEHERGFIRGLVCNNCNYNIGKFEVDFLRKDYPTYEAIRDYLLTEGVWE